MREFDDAVLSVLQGRGVPPWVDAAFRRIRPDRILIDAAAAERTVRPLIVMLDHIKEDGLPLTAAGYLRPQDVRILAEAIDIDWPGRSDREVDTVPIAVLRDTVMVLKLARRYKGRLRLTRAGQALRSDPVALWWHVAAALPLDRDDEYLLSAAVLQLLSLVLSGTAHESVPDTLYQLGWRTSDGRVPMHVWGATSQVLMVLGLSEGWLRTMPPQEHRRAFGRAALTQVTVSEGRDQQEPQECLQLRVSLAGSDPEIWRRIVVPAGYTLPQFHLVLQGAMGWTDSHLHEFELGATRYGIPDPDWPELPIVSEAGFAVADVLAPGDIGRYVYDFGDGWVHDIVVEERVAATGPACVAGAGCCPPENVGGIGGFEEFLARFAEGDLDAFAWAPPGFDPTAFHPDRANEIIDMHLNGTEIQRVTYGYTQI